MLPAALAGASIVGGLIANRSRSGEAAKNRRFQERMRNTEWQAAVTDMEKAGMNPALAYQQGGASSPGGTMPRVEDAISPGISSAMQAKRLGAEIKAIEAGIRKTDAETDAVRGRPGRIFEPAVDRGVAAARRIFGGADAPVLTGRNMNIIQYEVGNSARNIADAVKKTISRITEAVRENWTIGPDTTQRNR